MRSAKPACSFIHCTAHSAFCCTAVRLSPLLVIARWGHCTRMMTEGSVSDRVVLCLIRNSYGFMHTTHKRTHTHTTQRRMHTQTHALTHACMYAYKQTCMHLRTQECARTHERTHARTHTHTHLRACVSVPCLCQANLIDIMFSVRAVHLARAMASRSSLKRNARMRAPGCMICSLFRRAFRDLLRYSRQSDLDERI